MLHRGVVEIDPAEPGRLCRVSVEAVNQRQGLPLLRRAGCGHRQRLQHGYSVRVIAAECERQGEIDRQGRVARRPDKAIAIVGLGFPMASRQILCHTEQEQELRVVWALLHRLGEGRQGQLRLAGL